MSKTLLVNHRSSKQNVLDSRSKLHSVVTVQYIPFHRQQIQVYFYQNHSILLWSVMAIMQNIVAFEIGKAYCTEVFGSVFFFKIFYYILWNCICVALDICCKHQYVKTWRKSKVSLGYSGQATDQSYLNINIQVNQPANRTQSTAAAPPMFSKLTSDLKCLSFL